MAADAPRATLAGEEHIYLLNRVSLDSYLSFMNDYPVDAQELDRGQLAQEWRACRDWMRTLREREAAFADRPPITPLPPEMAALTAQVEADPFFSRAFSDAPYEFGIIELERLVVSQKIVCADHLDRLRAQLGPRPTPADLFRFCMPFDHPLPTWRASRVDDETFVFVSESSDLRFLDAALLRPEQVIGYPAMGPMAGVVGLIVGFGSNYLSAVAVGNRVVLHNGHHRACALYAAGVRHAPIVLQTARHPEELEVLAPRAVQRDPEFYLSEPRPPVLKDYFDPRIGRRVCLAMNSKQVRIRYSVEEMDMP